MKVFTLKRRHLALVACVLAAAAMFWAVNNPAIVGASTTTRQLPTPFLIQYHSSLGGSSRLAFRHTFATRQSQDAVRRCAFPEKYLKGLTGIK